VLLAAFGGAAAAALVDALLAACLETGKRSSATNWRNSRRTSRSQLMRRTDSGGQAAKAQPGGPPPWFSPLTAAGASEMAQKTFSGLKNSGSSPREQLLIAIASQLTPKSLALALMRFEAQKNPFNAALQSLRSTCFEMAPCL
jgi:hypothetical protein